MLPTCTSSQYPYFVIHGTSQSSVGDTPGAACNAFAGGLVLKNATEHACDTSAGVFAISKLCEPLAPSPFSMSVADGLQLTGLILSVWVSAAVFRWFVAAVRGKGDQD